MRHRNSGKVLDRKKGPRAALLKSLATSVVLHEKVQTTKAKAKAVRSFVEKSITSGKTGTLAARRTLAGSLGENASKKLIEDLGIRYKTRPGGYTRITNLGRRQGDGAEMAQIELV